MTPKSIIILDDNSVDLVDPIYKGQHIGWKDVNCADFVFAQVGEDKYKILKNRDGINKVCSKSDIIKYIFS